jgi:ABC-2 type transport system ATP-binding protein
MNTIFSAKNIVKKYAAHLALDDVSIDVKKGAVFGLLGPNGAGKTTLIRIINQITAPDEGSVTFKGNKLSPEDIYKIGYLPEERGLYKKMKVGEQSLYLAQLKGLSKPQAMKKLKYWFTKFDIIDWWDKKVEELSKGMQQKIQFVTTVIHEPELLIFDEPFSGFDPINANLLKNEILELKNKGATIIFSTHNMASVEELCDDIALINKSKVILSGNILDIKEQFKQHIFELWVRDAREIDALDSKKYELISHEKISDNEDRFRVRLLNKTSENELVSDFMNIGTLRSFSEVIPSMNEVFIDAVNKKTEQNI